MIIIQEEEVFEGKKNGRDGIQTFHRDARSNRWHISNVINDYVKKGTSRPLTSKVGPTTHLSISREVCSTKEGVEKFGTFSGIRLGQISKL